MAFPIAAVLAGASAGAQGLGGMAANQATIQGAKSALNQQRIGQQLVDQIFAGSIAREMPWISAGKQALPLAEMAFRGEGEGFKSTPAYQFRNESGRASLADLIQGSAPSAFAENRFSRGLDVSEQGLNRARLADLLAIGLGSSGTAGQESANLANLATQNALQRGALQGGMAQTGYEMRQNAVNQALGTLGGVPSYYASSRPMLGSGIDWQNPGSGSLNGVTGYWD